MAGDDDGLTSLLAAVVEWSPDAILSLTLDGVITSWNAGATAVYGYTAEEMVGHEGLVLFLPGELEERAAILDRVRAGRRVGEVEARRVRKDGAVIDVALSVSPIRDTAGAVTGMAVVVRDITEARVAREAQSRLAAIVESAPDAIISGTLDGVITAWNSGAAQMYGYTAEEMIGRKAERLVPPDRAGEMASLLEAVRGGEPVKYFETRRARKDGAVIDVSVSVSPIHDPSGALVGVATVARDVTERNRAIEAARELGSRLAAIVESSSDAIIGMTLDGVITTWNAGAADMFGYAPQEMIGHNLSELMPADRADELAPILERVRQGQRVTDFETRRVRKDGAVIEVSVSVSPVRGEDGTVTGAATVTRDITERARAEAERQASEARLHTAERLETVGQLAGGIAHDFNNLLAAIIGYAGLVAEETGNPAARADVEEILATAQRAAALTKELLVFSLARAGRAAGA